MQWHGICQSWGRWFVKYFIRAFNIIIIYIYLTSTLTEIFPPHPFKAERPMRKALGVVFCIMLMSYAARVFSSSRLSETLCLIDFACELGSNVVDQAFSRIVSIVWFITHSVLLKLISVPLRLLCTLGYAYKNRQTKEVYMGGLGCPCQQKLYLRKLRRMWPSRGMDIGMFLSGSSWWPSLISLRIALISPSSRCIRAYRSRELEVSGPYPDQAYLLKS